MTHILADLKALAILQSSYSFNVTFSDFFLFLRLKTLMKGYNFDIVDKVKSLQLGSKGYSGGGLLWRLDISMEAMYRCKSLFSSHLMRCSGSTYFLNKLLALLLKQILYKIYDLEISVMWP